MSTTNTSDISLSEGNVKLKVLGKSGNFRIDNGDKFILFTLNRLQEVDSNGKRVQFVNPHVFKTALNWGPVTPNVMIPGSTVAATMVELNASFTLGKPQNGKKADDTISTSNIITFGLQVYIATATGSYTFAESTFPVNKDDVKYTISIGNWPFVDPTNLLQFGLAMQTNTTTSTGENSVKTLADTNSASVAIGNAIIETPLVAIIDDVVTNNVLTSTYGSGSGIQFSFPSFSKSLVYDPTVNTSGTTDTSAYTTPNTDADGTTVVAGDETLVTPDTTSSDSPDSDMSYIWLICAMFIVLVMVVVFLMRRSSVSRKIPLLQT